MLLIEPLLMSTWGTTFGKKIFGLVVRDKEGKKLKIKAAATRTWGVFGVGNGYNIPIYNFIRQYKSYKKCTASEPLPWEEDCSYLIKDVLIVRRIAYVVLLIATGALTYLISLQATMPINRGDITAIEYAENCNDFISYIGYDIKYMNEQGKWVDYPGSTFVYTNPYSFPGHELTITKGLVTGVKIEIETEDSCSIDGWVNQKIIAVMGFLAAQKKANCISINRSDILKIVQKGLENYTEYEAGVRVKNEVQYTGYTEYAEGYLFPNEGEEQSFHMIFTLEKVEP
jgi:hypothetical protein